MTAEANAETLHKVYDALATGNFVGLMALLSNDITAHVPGRSPLAGLSWLSARAGFWAV